MKGCTALEAGSQLTCHLIFICKRPVFPWSVRSEITKPNNRTAGLTEQLINFYKTDFSVSSLLLI